MAIKGIHTYYTTPNKAKLPNYEVIVLVMSALYYRKYIGPVELYCNQPIKDYLVKNNLDQYWDKVDTDISLEFNKIKNSKALFMYGAFKNYVIEYIKVPFIIMNHDFMFKSAIPSELLECDVRFLHLEEKDLETYLPHADPNFLWGYRKFNNWDVGKIANTGAVYFNNQTFSYRFSTNISNYYRNIFGRDARSDQKVHFDQQLLMMLLEVDGLEVNTFSNFIYDPITRELKRYSDDPLKEQVIWYRLWANKHSLKYGHSATFYDRMKFELGLAFPKEYSNLKYLLK